MNLIWIATCLAIVYGGISALAGTAQFKERTIPLWSILTMIILGLIMIISAILTVTKPFVIFSLILCLFLMHVLAILNGLHLNGKIRWSHQLVRVCISFLIILFYLL